MEFVVYVSIGVTSIAFIVGIPALIWRYNDLKKQEQEEQAQVE